MILSSFIITGNFINFIISNTKILCMRLCCVIMSILVTSYILNIKYSSDVLNPLIPSVLLRHVECSGDQVFLVILNLDHFPLYGLVGDELVDEDRLGLAEPVDPVEALPLAGRVPGGVQQEEMIGGSEIQPDTASLNQQNEIKSEVRIMRIFTRRLSSITLGEL